jgi:hypothetical protein
MTRLTLLRRESQARQKLSRDFNLRCHHPNSDPEECIRILIILTRQFDVSSTSAIQSSDKSCSFALRFHVALISFSSLSTLVFFFGDCRRFLHWKLITTLTRNFVICEATKHVDMKQHKNLHFADERRRTRASDFRQFPLNYFISPEWLISPYDRARRVFILEEWIPPRNSPAGRRMTRQRENF